MISEFLYTHSIHRNMTESYHFRFAHNLIGIGDTVFMKNKTTSPIPNFISDSIQALKMFLTCGLFGICMEVLFTSLNSLRQHDKTASAKTSIWMFPIYGMAALICPLSKKLKGKSFIYRGTVYAILIMCTEGFTGFLLKQKEACPWNYSASSHHIHGLVRPDYFPYWFFAGLFFEKIVNTKEFAKCHNSNL